MLARSVTDFVSDLWLVAASCRDARLLVLGRDFCPGNCLLLPPGIEQPHSEIVHVADIPGDQRQFVYKRSCGQECVDDRPRALSGQLSPLPRNRRIDTENAL